jgi:hypothetical protein
MIVVAPLVQCFLSMGDCFLYHTHGSFYPHSGEKVARSAG